MDKSKEVIERFVKRYRREFDYYETAAMLAAQELRSALRENGIRAIITSRAKDAEGLRDKLIRRAKEKKYENDDQIYKDIVDLAGARIALYFPQDKKGVEQLILDRFRCDDHAKDIRQFPDPKKPPTVGKVFSGYAAIHYRVKLKEERLSDSQMRYSEARIEVQVASVLMHAWSEVEHDLVYKPSTALSEEELAILDELNGLVLAGEIALKRLQNASASKASSKGFENHYQLAAYILNTLAAKLGHAPANLKMGRADVLLRFLEMLGKGSTPDINALLETVDPESDRPITEQIVEDIVGMSEDSLKLYESAVFESGESNPYSSSNEKRPAAYVGELGAFLYNYARTERLIRDTLSKLKPEDFTSPFQPVRPTDLRDALGISDSLARALDAVRQWRNSALHQNLLLEKQQFEYARQVLNEIALKVTEVSNEASQPILNIVEDIDAKK